MKCPTPLPLKPTLEKLNRCLREHAGAVIAQRCTDRREAEGEPSLAQLIAFLRDRRYGVFAVTFQTETSGAASPSLRLPGAYFVFNLGVEGDDGGTLEGELQAAAELLGHDGVLSLRIGAPAMLIGTSRRAGVWPAFAQRRPIADITPESSAQNVLAAIHGQPLVIAQAHEMAYPDSLFGVWGMRAVAKSLEQRLRKS